MFPAQITQARNLIKGLKSEIAFKNFLGIFMSWVLNSSHPWNMTIALAALVCKLQQLRLLLGEKERTGKGDSTNKSYSHCENNYCCSF